MASFKDSKKRVWVVEIDVTTIKRIKSVLGVDLLTVADDSGQMLDRLASDAVFLVDLLYVICKDQADKLKVTDEDFGRLFSKGEIIQAAGIALQEAIIDFFPEPRKGLMKAIFGKTTQIRAAVARKALTAMDSPEFKQAVESLLNSPVNSSGSARASSGSTRARSRSGN
jgi:hypothetical protein